MKSRSRMWSSVMRERERHWRMVFEDNNGGVDGTKAFLHANKWYV